MTLVIRFEAGLRPVIKHLTGQHDQKTHGEWATGSTKSELSDDEYRDIVYSAKTVEEAYSTIAKRLGKSMKPQVAELSEDEINVYRGVQNVERDTKRLLDGKIKFTDFQTWGQGIYVDPTKERAADYGTVLGLRLDPSAKIVRGEMTWDKGIDIRWQNDNARVRGQWSSDFVDMGRIKMNPDDMGRPNYSVSDLKNLYWASKGYDGFSPHGGEMVLFNGEKLTLNQSTVKKHGTHDQKTHGNWATGNFEEETDGADAQDSYFSRYGIKTDGTKELVGVSRDEVSAIDFYTGDGFKDINSFWRDGKNETTPNNTSQEVEWNSIETLSSNLDKLIDESPEMFGDKNLFRIYSQNVMDSIKEGDVVVDKGYLSTTRVDITNPSRGNRGHLENLQIISESADIPAVILPSPSGKGKGLAVDYLKNSVQDSPRVTNVATANREKEVLLPRSTPLKFMGYKKVNDLEVAVFQRMDK